MQPNYVRVHSFYNTHEFIVLRLKFDEEGIRYRLENELMMQAEPNISFTGEGMPLKVHPEDAKRAVELLVEGKIIPPPGEEKHPRSFLDRIAFNLRNQHSRATTLIALVVSVGLVIAFLSWALLQFG